jgi:hypothetical protein
MAEHSNDQFSSFQHYQKRLEELMGTAREGIERQAPEVLDKAAATANSIARRLEAMASDARQRAAAKEATPEPAGTTSESASEPPVAPPASSAGGPTTF